MCRWNRGAKSVETRPLARRVICVQSMLLKTSWIQGMQRAYAAACFVVRVERAVCLAACVSHSQAQGRLSHIQVTGS